MPTLHSNNPVPSNGSVATVIRGVKSISMTLSGVGAVRAVVQIMAHEDGAAPGPIGNQIVVSGTTTVTTTQTFNAEAGQVYLQLVDITPACKFSATLTELGPIQDTNPGSPASPFATEAERTAWATANLATLRSGVTTVWGPGAVEYVWNGPLATDWLTLPYINESLVEVHAYPISVPSITQNKTVPVLFELGQNSMDAAGNYVPSTKGVSITGKLPGIGVRYRVSVNPGFLIVWSDGTYNIKHSMQQMEIVSKVENMALCIKRINETTEDLLVSQAAEIGLTISRVLIKGNAEYDFIVAASNSSDSDKQLADLVCDGTADEHEIMCAVNCNISVSPRAKVLLLPGDYNLSAVHPYYYGQGLAVPVRGNNAIWVAQSEVGANQTYNVEICTRNHQHTDLNNNSTRINVTQEMYDALNNANENAIIGAFRFGPTKFGTMRGRLGLHLKGLFFLNYGLEKSIVAVDGIGFAQLGVENCIVASREYINFFLDSLIPNSGLIGVRGVHGSNRGVDNYVKNSAFIGCGEGLSLTGEHFIVQDCLAHHCAIGWTLGQWDVLTNVEHTNVFIGMSVEQCIRHSLLNWYGATVESDSANIMQPLDYTGGSVEMHWTNSLSQQVRMLPCKEIVRGAYSGKWETKFDDAGPMFESGSGVNLTQRNLRHRTQGPTAKRPAANACQAGFRYMDTTLGYPVYVNAASSGWVTGAGVAA